MQEIKEMWFSSLDWEDLLEKGMVTHSSILARKIPWREESVRLQSILSQRVGHNWATENACMDRISSRYLRFSSEQARWSHRLEEGEGLRDKTLVGSKERPLGRGTGPKPWTGNSLPFPDRGEDTPKEQQVWATKWWPVWLKFNDTRWDGKSLLGLTSCWVLLACLESLDFILQWKVIGKRQTEKWFT